MLSFLYVYILVSMFEKNVVGKNRLIAILKIRLIELLWIFKSDRNF